MLFERGDQQELAEPRAVDRDRLADEVFHLVDAGAVLGDDGRGAWLVDHELREHQRRARDHRREGRRGAAAEAEIGAASGYGLKGRRMVGKRAKPFDFDAVLRQPLLELAAFFRDQREAEESPRQPHGVGVAALRICTRRQRQAKSAGHSAGKGCAKNVAARRVQEGRVFGHDDGDPC